MHELAGRRDHRADDRQPAAVQYGPAHEVERLPGGLLERIGLPPRFAVNSVHGQAVDRLADGLRVEAVAGDGVIEAFSLPSAPGFVLALQWHPEWRAAENPESVRLFAAFGAAVRTWRDRVRGPLPVLA